MKDLTFTLDDYLQTTGDPQEEIRQAERCFEGQYPPASTEWQNSPIARGNRFKELITRKSLRERAIAPSLVNQLELIDRNDLKTLEDGVKRYQKQWAVPYVQEFGSDWQYITESKKDKRGYVYLAPAKAGNRAFFPAIPTDIRKAIGDRHGVSVPLDRSLSFWEWVKTEKSIPIEITEGGGKALSALSHGYAAIAVYGCSCLGSPDLIDYFKGRDIRISLDSDSKPSAVRAVTRSLAKHLRAISKIAKSVKVVTWDSTFKGLDDLLAMGGAEAYEHAIANSVTADEWLANHTLSIAKGRLEASKIKADLELDRLPTFAELQELLKTHPDIFLTGAKGLGKSEKGGEFVRSAANALLPVPLESLARNNSNRMSDDKEGSIFVDYRTDCDRINGQLVGGAGYVSRLSFCTEAIHGLKNDIESCLQRGAVVFNDELDLQLNSLATSSTHAQNGKRRLNQSLYWDMQIRAKQTLSVSADLTQYEAELWERKTGRRPFVIRVNTPKKNYKVKVFGDPIALLFGEVKPAIASGKRILISCSRKSETKFLQWLFRDYGAIAVHRDNANDPIFKGSDTEPDFFEKPNQWLEKHQPKILIVSPVLRSGFSITHNAFDESFCFYHADSVSASTALQLSDRYRLLVPKYIYAAQSSGKYNHITPESILKTRKVRAGLAGDEEFRLIDEHDSYYHYQAADNWSKANFRADIIARLQDEVEEVEIDYSEASDDERSAYKALRDDFKAWLREQMYKARNLTRLEYEAMKDQRNLPEPELLAVEKFRLANWSDTLPDTVAIDQIERDNNGRKRIALERLEKQAYPVLAIATDKASKEIQEKWGAGYSHQDVTHFTLAQKSLEKLGVHEFLDYALSGNVWSQDTEIVQKLGTALRNSRNYTEVTCKNGKVSSTKVDQLSEAGVNLTCGKTANDNTYIGALMNWLGLKTTSEQKRVNGGERMRFYSLCPEDMQITREELNRRAERLIREGLNLTGSHSFVDKLYSVSHTFLYSPIQEVCDSKIINEIAPEVADDDGSVTSNIVELPLQQPQPIPDQNIELHPSEQIAPHSARSPKDIFVRYVGRFADQYQDKLLKFNKWAYGKLNCKLPDGSFTTWLDKAECIFEDAWGRECNAPCPN